jgi:hypothetical protein
VSEDQKRCFVIMPFSETTVETVEHTEDYWTKHYKHFLKPLIEECQLEAHRSTPLRGSIVGQIITDLVTSSVVVADLTGANPNVYWELGVRHSFRHGTILIAQNDTELPFDIKDTGTLFYDPDHLDVNDFRKNFKDAIRDCLENSDKTDSHVIETLSGRGALYEIIRREETLSRLDAVLSECKYNRSGLESIIKQVQSNRDDPQNSKIVTARFRLRAAELLATNRYIDEDQSFYTVVENYLDILTMMNTQLELWAHPDFGNPIEESLLEQGKVATKVSETFQDKVETKVFEVFEYRIVDVLCHHEPVRKNIAQKQY